MLGSDHERRYPYVFQVLSNEKPDFYKLAQLHVSRVETQIWFLPFSWQRAGCSSVCMFQYQRCRHTHTS